MEFESAILAYVKKHPGTSSKEILSYININRKKYEGEREDSVSSLTFKKLRVLKRKGIIHNRGDSWYFLKCKYLSIHN